MMHRKTYSGRIADVEPRLLEALKAEGFGLLSRLAFDEILREKRGVEIAPYVRLGVCNPELAQRALEQTPTVGVVLPCAVVLREVPGGVEAFFLDPKTAFLAVSKDVDLELAEEVGRRLLRALNRVEVSA